jgi:hypothetical protein
MNFETIPAEEFGKSLSGLSVNLLVRDVRAQATFLKEVFGIHVHRLSNDFAICVHAGHPFQLHSDQSFSSHPIYGLLPEAGPRGAGIELRLHEVDPDLAVEKLAGFPDAVLLAAATDKPGHGLREAVILCPNGYAWVPSTQLR